MPFARSFFGYSRSSLSCHIGLERGDERLRLLLPDFAPDIGRLALDLVLDGEQLVDTACDLESRSTPWSAWRSRRSRP
jgi:hypothetical protein